MQLRPRNVSRKEGFIEFTDAELEDISIGKEKTPRRSSNKGQLNLESDQMFLINATVNCLHFGFGGV